MESIRLLKGVSEVIDTKQFIQKWDSSVIPGLHVYDDANLKETEDDVLKNEMDVPLETIKELKVVCGLQTLKYDEEQTDVDLLTKIPDVDLMTVKFQKQELQKRNDPTYKTFVNKKVKYKEADEKLMASHDFFKKSLQDIPTCNRIVCDIIMEVTIHSPFKPSCMGSRSSGVKLVVDQKFLVLGSQPLTELRQKIMCVNDLAVAGDFSEDPNSTQGYYAKDIYKSGFFYIEGVFYNDMTEPESRDYSETIIKWAKEEGRGIDEMVAKNMADTCFTDLKVRLGQPYLYMHQGDCEHIIMFNDIRLSNSGDSQDKYDYPRLIHKRTFNRTICRVCSVHSARWLTYGSEEVPQNPAFFCDLCFKHLHYTEDGEKIGQFEAYKFFDTHCVI